MLAISDNYTMKKTKKKKGIFVSPSLDLVLIITRYISIFLIFTTLSSKKYDVARLHIS